jgi:hypothetical protein
LSSFASSDENLSLSTSHSKSFQRFSKTWLGFGYQLPRFISCSVASWFMLLTRNSTPPPPPHPPKTPQCPCSKMDLKFQILDPSSQIHETRCTVVSLSVITNRPSKYCITICTVNATSTQSQNFKKDTISYPVERTTPRTHQPRFDLAFAWWEWIKYINHRKLY